MTLYVLIGSALILAPFKAFLRLDGVNDVGDDRAAHRHGNSLVLAHGWLLAASMAATVMHRVG